MTVTYSKEIATTHYWTFFRLLLRWKGSVYKLIWFELLLFCLAYGTLSAVYRLVMTPDQRKIFEEICLFCEKSSNSIPVAFVLGFFVSLIVKRWWDQFMALPWPDRAAIFLSGFITGTTEEAILVRRQIIRYLNLSYAMCMRSISSPVKKRFPSEQHLVAAGLMTAEELDTYNEVDVPYNKFYIPIAWAAKIACAARRKGLMKQDPQINMMMNEINSFRDQLQLLFWYDWINPPLVYVQVATISVHSYFMISLFARQFILSDTRGGHRVDYYIPFFTIFQFIFYMGWLKVAESLINPFGEDDDDFDINYLIDRNLQVSYLIVDELHQNHPELVKDSFWDNNKLELPYNESLVKKKMTSGEFISGSVTNLPILKRKLSISTPRRESAGTLWYSSVLSLNSEKDRSGAKRSDVMPPAPPIFDTVLECPPDFHMPFVTSSPDEDLPDSRERMGTGESNYSMLV